MSHTTSPTTAPTASPTGRRLRDLDGAVALVTGASSGIGEATARMLAGHGATVVLLARRADRLEALARELGTADPVEADVTDAEAVRRAVDAAVERHGSLDVLVNNAGVALSALPSEGELEDWRTMVEVNLHGVLHATHAALPHLREAASGTRGVADVVTVSSASGRRVPKPQSAVYAATKHAVGAFSEGLRQELGAVGVRVGLVEPGFVATELTEGKDFGEAEALEADDVADAIAWMVTRPTHVGINEVLLRGTAQTS